MTEATMEATKSPRAGEGVSAGERVDVPLAALARSRNLPEEPPPGTGEALRDFGPAVAPLLEHPRWDDGASGISAAAEARDLLRVAGHDDAAAAVERFLERAEDLGAERLREIHGRTFDLAPSCVPYLSVHLFGEGSFQRARLMAGLAEAQSRAGFDRGPELPDHLAVVLRFAPHMEPEEWRELVRFCLIPALPAMARGLEEGDNPYREVLKAAELLLVATPTGAPRGKDIGDVPRGIPGAVPEIGGTER